mmetsp:Transcript_15468/g.26171  ORF Transcript_15468/g.26171 Transcript_15468/m.26171 type:complete len:112 (+) Transcript_15468:140-475(+)
MHEAHKPPAEQVHNLNLSKYGNNNFHSTHNAYPAHPAFHNPSQLLSKESGMILNSNSSQAYNGASSQTQEGDYKQKHYQTPNPGSMHQRYKSKFDFSDTQYTNSGGSIVHQ